MDRPVPQSKGVSVCRLATVAVQVMNRDAEYVGWRAPVRCDVIPVVSSDTLRSRPLFSPDLS
jgi:hypothetical protein